MVLFDDARSSRSEQTLCHSSPPPLRSSVWVRDWQMMTPELLLLCIDARL